MTTLPTYTEADLRATVGADIFARGRDYYENGMVEALVQRGDTLYASVAGSDDEPYQVTVRFADNQIADAECTCPYDWGGWCKHIVAALLAARKEPDSIEQRAPLPELLAPLTREQLLALVVELAVQQPVWLTTVESWIAQQALTSTIAAGTVATISANTQHKPPATVPLDAKAVQKQVRSALRGVSRVEVADQMLAQVETMLAAGEGRNALTLLDALTDEFIGSLPDPDERYGYDNYDSDEGDDESYGWLEAVGAVWAEVILSVDLSQDEADELRDSFAGWAEAAEEQGFDPSFHIAELALTYGWDYAPLQRAMQGEITELGAWEDEAPLGADELAVARLKVLARQGRTDAYLNLALAEGQHYAYVLMLADLGRVAEAVQEGKQALTQTQELLTLAQKLSQQGATDAAIEIADHALAHGQGEQASVASWLRDLHISHGDLGRALPAAITALAAAPKVAEYQQLKQLAGADWPTVRVQALAALQGKRSYFSNLERAQIFLSEAMWDEAIAAVDGDYASPEIHQLMPQLYGPRPDWVIRRAGQYAEAIMNAGKADRYSNAVSWLAHVKEAYTSAGRQAEWKAYLAKIRETHQRKYKLMGLLKGL